jgi:sigma-B regulation protein RsbU (phosphoserine phosphatase)
MNHRGISFRLNSNITSIAIILIASIVYLNYYFSNKVIIGKIEEGAINESNLVISKVSRITVGAEEVARNVAYQSLYYNKNNDLDFFLKQVLKSNSLIESIQVELFDNKKDSLLKFSSNLPDQYFYDPDIRKFKQSPSKLKSETENFTTGLWSDPYYCRNDSIHIYVSYKIPVYTPDKKEFTGIVTCVVSLNRISQLLSEIKIGKNGYAFVIDKTGRFLTHPKSNWILKRNLFEKPSIIFQDNVDEIELKIRNGGKGAGYGISQYLKTQKSWYYFAPLKNTNWTIIVVVPEKELFQEVNSIFQEIILVSGIGILILFLLNMFVFKRILDPLVRVVLAIQRFSSTDSVKNNSRNEIKMLAESLENWQSKYGVLIKEQINTSKEKIKYEKDIKSAREIQFNIIPSGKPVFTDYPEIDLYAILKPAESVGGDLYDYFFIDKNHLLVAIGDVSGKGIPASLFMAIASTLIKTHAKILSAKEIVSRVNKELSERNSNQYFVTLFIGIIDTRTGIMDYCNAAHNFPYILHPDRTLKTLSKSHGLPLGIYKTKTYSSSTVELVYGDMIVLYTDGVINSKDSKNQHYGVERLEKNIQNLSDLSAEEAANRLVKSILIYEGDEKQADDITLLTLIFLPKTENQA